MTLRETLVMWGRRRRRRRNVFYVLSCLASTCKALDFKMPREVSAAVSYTCTLQFAQQLFLKTTLFFFNFHPASMTCAVDCQLCMEAIASFATQIRALAKTGDSQTTSGACSYLENLSCSQQQQASGQGRKASR